MTQIYAEKRCDRSDIAEHHITQQGMSKDMPRSLYSFETPEGKHIMTVELYRGLLVGPDGMYAYTVPQSAVSE